MISVVGMGPGDSRYLTRAAQQVIDQAEILVGWPRALAAFPDFHGETVTLGSNLEQLVAWLPQVAARNVVVLASGDPSLYGIGKRLLGALGADTCRVEPGISAVQYLFARIGLDMNDLYLTSSHGKQPDFDFLFLHDKVALVTDKLIGPFQIAAALRERGLSRTLIIGENLSYPDERLHVVQPDEVQTEYDMNVVVVLNERR